MCWRDHNGVEGVSGGRMIVNLSGRRRGRLDRILKMWRIRNGTFRWRRCKEPNLTDLRVADCSSGAARVHRL